MSRESKRRDSRGPALPDFPSSPFPSLSSSARIQPRATASASAPAPAPVPALVPASVSNKLFLSFPDHGTDPQLWGRQLDFLLLLMKTGHFKRIKRMCFSGSGVLIYLFLRVVDVLFRLETLTQANRLDHVCSQHNPSLAHWPCINDRRNSLTIETIATVFKDEFKELENVDLALCRSWWRRMKSWLWYLLCCRCCVFKSTMGAREEKGKKAESEKAVELPPRQTRGYSRVRQGDSEEEREKDLLAWSSHRFNSWKSLFTFDPQQELVECLHALCVRVVSRVNPNHDTEKIQQELNFGSVFMVGVASVRFSFDFTARCDTVKVTNKKAFTEEMQSQVSHRFPLEEIKARSDGSPFHLIISNDRKNRSGPSIPMVQMATSEATTDHVDETRSFLVSHRDSTVHLSLLLKQEPISGGIAPLDVRSFTHSVRPENRFEPECHFGIKRALYSLVATAYLTSDTRHRDTPLSFKQDSWGLSLSLGSGARLDPFCVESALMGAMEAEKRSKLRYPAIFSSLSSSSSSSSLTNEEDSDSDSDELSKILDDSDHLYDFRGVYPVQISSPQSVHRKNFFSPVELQLADVYSRLIDGSVTSSHGMGGYFSVDCRRSHTSMCSLLRLDLPSQPSELYH